MKKFTGLTRPCRLCGGEAQVAFEEEFFNGGARYRVKCERCLGQSTSFSNCSDAISFWNDIGVAEAFPENFRGPCPFCGSHLCKYSQERVQLFEDRSATYLHCHVFCDSCGGTEQKERTVYGQGVREMVQNGWRVHSAERSLRFGPLDLYRRSFYWPHLLFSSEKNYQTFLKLRLAITGETARGCNRLEGLFAAVGFLSPPGMAEYFTRSVDEIVNAALYHVASCTETANLFNCPDPSVYCFLVQEYPEAFALARQEVKSALSAFRKWRDPIGRKDLPILSYQNEILDSSDWGLCDRLPWRIQRDGLYGMSFGEWPEANDSDTNTESRCFMRRLCVFSARDFSPYESKNVGAAEFFALDEFEAVDLENTDVGPGKVYLITDEESYKIGFTEGDPEKRLTQLQTGNPRRLRLAAAISGSREKEKQIHQQFSEYRGVGEWFQAPRLDLLSVFPSAQIPCPPQ